jgi:SulP family sulfate permease
VSKVTEDYVRDGFVHTLQDKDIPPYVAIFRIHGPFLFGATDKILDITRHIDELPPIVIIRLRNMTALDATGLLALQDLAETLHAHERTLLVCGAMDQPRKLMAQAGFAAVVGRENICDSVLDALARAEVAFGAAPVT